MKCAVPSCDREDIVFSGTDAIMFGGIRTEKYCYKCALAYYTIGADVESLV
jgi:hypothetical protein